MLIELDKELSLEQILDNNFDLTVLYFSAKWCGPCKNNHPKIVEYANDIEYQQKIVFVKIDIDEYEELTNTCNIESLPTFKIYKNKKLENTIEGIDNSNLFMSLNLLLE